jgi:hypothetical protein
VSLNRPDFWLGYVRAAVIWIAILLALNWAMLGLTGHSIPWIYVVALGLIWPALMLLIT